MRQLPNPEGLSPARKNLRRALLESGVDMQQLSYTLKLNKAYIQQYMTKGSPKILPAAVRQRISETLGNILPTELLDDNDSPIQRAGRKPRVSLLEESAPRHPSRPVRRPRILREGSPLDPKLATYGPLGSAMHVETAIKDPICVILSHHHSLLQPRHVLVCDPDDAGRTGDMVVSETGGDLLIGILVPGTRGGIEIATDATAERSPAGDAIWRVHAIYTA